MTRDKRIARQIVCRIELVVQGSTETRVANVHAARFLIEQSIGNVEHEAARKAAVYFELKCTRASPAGVPVGGQEVSQTVRKWSPRFIGRRFDAVSFERIATIAILVCDAEWSRIRR